MVIQAPTEPPREGGRERGKDRPAPGFFAGTAAPAARRTAAQASRRTAALHVDNRISPEATESPLLRKSEPPSAISDLPATGRFPALRPNRPNPPIPGFSPETARITEIGLHGQIGHNRRFPAFRTKPAEARPLPRLDRFRVGPRQSDWQCRQLSLDKPRPNQVKNG